MLFSRKYLSLLLVIICFSLFAVSAHAQQTGQADQAEEVRPYRPIVRLHVLVMDSSNHPVTDLRAEEVRVLEDGRQQSILYFSHDEIPVSYGIVVDASGSQREALDDILKAGRKIVESNKPADETFIMRFTDTDNIEVEQGLTSDKDTLAEEINSISIESGPPAVNDAIDRAAEYLRKSARVDKDTPRRRAIILITDGEDRGSRLRNPDILLNRLREEDVQFFIIGLSQIGKAQGSREKSANLLTNIARETGGRLFLPKTSSDISESTDEIVRDLRAQYVIGYSPTYVGPDGSFRKIQVSVPDSPTRKKLNVIARPGRLATR